MNTLQPFHLALVVAALACVSDWRSRRIPNLLTLSSALAGIVLAGLIGGAAGALTSAEGWLVGIAIFFPFFALGGLGAGDVKLLGAIGAWMGPAPTARVALYSAMAGGVLALAVALRSGYVRTAFRNIGFLLKHWTTVGLKPVDGLTLTAEKAPKLAYAFPIFTGLVVTLWLR
jgi:prepilin peptidase CpaA